MILKENLHRHCLDLLKARLEGFHAEYQELRVSLTSETKSSMGDKYETAREMIDLEKDKLSRSIEETSKMDVFLKQIDPSKISDEVKVGSLIRTRTGLFFLSVSLGKIQLYEENIFLVSPVSPIGKAMLGMKVNESFELNKIQHEILEIL